MRFAASDADKLEELTATNCPGVDASKRMYLGGTSAVLHAADKGDTLFRHWVSGTDAIEASDARWASVVMTALMWAPFDCITAWSAGGENTAVFAAQNAIGTAIVSALASGAQQQQQQSSDSTLSKLKAQAQEAKEAAKPGMQAASAILAAKSVYDAAAAGNIGIETSAYEAWGSQASLSVFGTCMAGRASGAVESMLAVGR